MPSFPYQLDALNQPFPSIPLSIIYKDKRREVFALIDSGATISVFRPDIADSLSIVISSGKKVFLGGVGGRIKGFIHDLEVDVGGQRFLCPVVFSREYFAPFNLLGRDAFFEKFRIIFEEKKKQVILE